MLFSSGVRQLLCDGGSRWACVNCIRTCVNCIRRLEGFKHFHNRQCSPRGSCCSVRQSGLPVFRARKPSRGLTLIKSSAPIINKLLIGHKISDAEDRCEYIVRIKCEFLDHAQSRLLRTLDQEKWAESSRMMCCSSAQARVDEPSCMHQT